MSPSDAPSPRRGATVAVVAALLVVASWPFLVYLRAVPITPDAVVWIERSAAGADGWSEWVFRTSHFVGYRPLAGLSYWLDTALFGLSPLALRATDLALHLGAGVLVALVARRLAGRAAAVVTAVVFLAHPAANEVVPFLARRSYSLATLFAFGGLLAAHRAAGGSMLRLALVGPLLACAMLSHELGAVLALALPVVAFAGTESSERRRAAVVTAWGGAWLVAVFLVRRQVVGDLGGYETAGESRALDVARLSVAGVGGRLGDVSGGAAWVAALPAIYLAGAAAWLTRSRGFAAAGVLLVLVAFVAIVVQQGVWFPREAYCGAALLALLAGLVVARTSADPTCPARRVHLVAQLALLAFVLAGSPVVRGPSAGRVAKARAATAYADDVRAALATIEAPAAVDLVVPVVRAGDAGLGAVRSGQGGAATQRRLRVGYRWLRLVGTGAGVDVGEVAYVDDADRVAAPVVRSRAPLAIGFPDGAEVYVPAGRRLRALAPREREVVVRRRTEAGAPHFVWVGELVPVE